MEPPNALIIPKKETSPARVCLGSLTISHQQTTGLSGSLLWKRMEANQMRKAKSYSGLAVARELARHLGVLAETQRQAEGWGRMRVYRGRAQG